MGFMSHITNGSMMEIFADHCILLVNEEHYTSHINQPYNQSVMKIDKMEMLSHLDITRAHHKGLLKPMDPKNRNLAMQEFLVLW